MTFPTVTNTSTGHVAIYRVIYQEPLADVCARLQSDLDALRAVDKELRAALATAEALTIF